MYDWDTRTVADGRYEVKVIASDAGSNPPGTGKTASRVSDPITVDNTPPVIGDVKSQQQGADIHITLKVVDRTSTVAAVDYSVDSSKDWQFVLPTDQIYDSPEETVAFSIPNLKPGQHQVTLRATDSKGNQSFENLFVNVQGARQQRRSEEIRMSNEEIRRLRFADAIDPIRISSVLSPSPVPSPIDKKPAGRGRRVAMNVTRTLY